MSNNCLLVVSAINKLCSIVVASPSQAEASSGETGSGYSSSTIRLRRAPSLPSIGASAAGLQRQPVRYVVAAWKHDVMFSSSYLACLDMLFRVAQTIKHAKQALFRVLDSRLNSIKLVKTGCSYPVNTILDC